MERSTIFNGEIHYFDWVMFNSYVSHYQRVVEWMPTDFPYGDVSPLWNPGIQSKSIKSVRLCLSPVAFRCHMFLIAPSHSILTSRPNHNNSMIRQWYPMAHHGNDEIQEKIFPHLGAQSFETIQLYHVFEPIFPCYPRGTCTHIFALFDIPCLIQYVIFWVDLEAG